MAVLVKYKGIITVLNKVFKICDLAEAVQKTCPIDGGKHEISVTETFPSYAPSVSLISPKVHHSPDLTLSTYCTQSDRTNTSLVTELIVSSRLLTKSRISCTAVHVTLHGQ